MSYGFSVVVRGRDATPEAFREMARRAEALALDGLWCSAHVVLPPQVRSGYVMIPGRQHPEHWKEAYWEPFTVLSYLAGHTHTVTLGTSVVVLPMHNPFEVAKQAAGVDQLSGGRFVLGVGVGWFEEEFEVLGQDFHTRGARTDDALALIRSLWREDPVSYRGRFYRVEGAHFAPKPVRRPHPPIWIAGSSPAALRRAARFGNAWHPVRPSFDFLRQARAELARHLDAEGRSPESLDIAVKLPLVFQREPSAQGQFPTEGRPADIADALRRFRDLGAGHFVFDLVPETLPRALDTMERFAQEVRPRLT